MASPLSSRLAARLSRGSRAWPVHAASSLWASPRVPAPGPRADPCELRAPEAGRETRDAASAVPEASLRNRAWTCVPNAPFGASATSPISGVTFASASWLSSTPGTSTHGTPPPPPGSAGTHNTPEDQTGPGGAPSAGSGVGPGGSGSAGAEPGSDPAKAVLAASLPYVLECGWTEAAMVEGARAGGMSPAMLSLFPRREAHLVEYFMDECRAKFEADSEARAAELAALADLGPRLQLVVRMRLEQQALYTSTWAQALSIQALPSNLPRTAEQRMQLIASLWGAAGERTRSDLESRALCTMLSAVYTASELFMLTDFSAGYEDTWQFVNRRMLEGLQAFAGLSAAQEQIQKASLALFQKLGAGFPAGGPWASRNPFGSSPGTRPHSHEQPPHTQPRSEGPPAEPVPSTGNESGSSSTRSSPSNLHEKPA